MEDMMRPIWVGKTMFVIPPRALVVHPEGERIAVVLHEGIVTILTEAGELSVPDDRQRELRERYFPEASKKISGGDSFCVVRTPTRT